MKKTLLILTALASLTMANYSAKADEDTSLAQLTEFVANPKSDLSQLDRDNLEKVGQLDEENFYQTHKSPEYKHTDFAIGTAHASRHHLLGDQASAYCYGFYNTLDALLTSE
jgi:hypothetical protein